MQLMQFIRVDESTLTRSGNLLSVKALGITRAKLAVVGEQRSSSSGGLSSSSASYIDAVSVSITTTGRPVALALVPDDTAANAYVQGGAGGVVLSLKTVRGSTDLGVGLVAAAGATPEHPPGIIKIDTPAAGTYTYKVQMKSSSAGTSVTVNNCILVAWEL